jgi:ribosomal protein S18 acetylase RimI-like enzyme
MVAQTQTEKIEIHSLSRVEITRFQAIADQMSDMKEAEYFARNFDFVEAGEREALLATYDGQDAAYCFLNWQPKYAFFRKLGIPEFQDLSVAPDYRRCGLATTMVAYCEARAREKGCEHIGLGVAVNSQFGPAQQLYGRLGYIPDGNGVTYDRKLIAPDEFRPVDDQLCLMMVKMLGNK